MRQRDVGVVQRCDFKLPSSRTSHAQPLAKWATASLCSGGFIASNDPNDWPNMAFGQPEGCCAWG